MRHACALLACLSMFVCAPATRATGLPVTDNPPIEGGTFRGGMSSVFTVRDGAGNVLAQGTLFSEAYYFFGMQFAYSLKNQGPEPVTRIDIHGFRDTNVYRIGNSLPGTAGYAAVSGGISGDVLSYYDYSTWYIYPGPVTVVYNTGHGITHGLDFIDSQYLWTTNITTAATSYATVYVGDYASDPIPVVAPFAALPEPPAWLLAATAGLCLAGYVWRRKPAVA
jgi:hypothetical protein